MKQASFAVGALTSVDQPADTGERSRDRERSHYLGLPLLLGLVAISLGWIATRPIAALTPDSIQYMSAAQNLNAGRGFVTTVTALESAEPSAPFLDWPPLYPILLSFGTGSPTVAGGLPAAPIRWARWLNLLLLGLSFVPLAALAATMLGRRAVVPILAFYAFFRPIQVVHSFAWSEGLFIATTLASMAAMVLSLGGARPRLQRTIWLVVAGLAAGAAASTRYLGIVVIAAGALTIVTCTASRHGRHTARRLGLFLAPSALPILAWLARNYELSGSFFGQGRAPSSLDAEQVLLQILGTAAADWLRPPAFSTAALSHAASAVSILAALVLAASAVRRFGPETLESSRGRMTGVTMALSFIGLYLLVISISALRVGFDPINTRLLAPLYPPMLLVLGAFIRGAYHDRATGGRERAFLKASVLVLLTLNAAASARWATGPREDRNMSWPYWRSVKMGETRWERSPLIAAARGLPGDALILSNVWEAVAMHAGKPAKPLPSKADPGWPETILRHRGAYALVQGGYRDDLIGLAELERIREGTTVLEPLVTDGGSCLYRIVHSTPESPRSPEPRMATAPIAPVHDPVQGPVLDQVAGPGGRQASEAARPL